MRIDIVKTKVYSFEELSDDAKQVVLEKLHEINVNYDWWNYVYEDAKGVGINITEFDIDRGSFCRGSCDDVEETAHLILKNHGNMCETYKTAKAFLDEIKCLANTPIIVEAIPDSLDNAENKFRRSILENYRIILQEEFEYLTDEEAIVETIKLNEREFTADGNIYRKLRR